MNRRELFASLTGLGALIGLPVKVKAIEKEPMPLCLVVTSEREEWTDEMLDRARALIREVLGPDCPPILFGNPGHDLKAIYREAPDVSDAVREAVREALPPFTIDTRKMTER